MSAKMNKKRLGYTDIFDSTRLGLWTEKPRQLNMHRYDYCKMVCERVSE